MTGPEHYREAERLLEATDAWDATATDQQPIIAGFIAEAQVHATLALAAATAQPPSAEFKALAEAWADVTGWTS